MAYERRSIRAGPWRISALCDGSMRLDGGSMWGVVPWTIWSKLTPPAADNTIAIALRPFLAEREDLKVLIEPGLGERWDDKHRGIYQIERGTTLEQSLAICGVAAEEITHVVASHCHFDHIGAWIVEREGRLQPLFPRARHFAPRIEIEVARRPDHVRRASYRPDDVLPLLDAGVLEGYAGDAELLPGLWAHDASGHSDGVSVITFNEDLPGETAIFWTDLVPTTHHVQPAYIMAYDIDVPRSFASRSHWLARAADGGWIGLFYHDDRHAFARVERAGKRFACVPIAGEA